MCFGIALHRLQQPGLHEREPEASRFSASFQPVRDGAIGAGKKLCQRRQLGRIRRGWCGQGGHPCSG